MTSRCRLHRRASHVVTTLGCGKTEKLENFHVLKESSVNYGNETDDRTSEEVSDHEPLDVLEELNEATRLVIYPCIHMVLLGDDIRELLATFSEEDQIGDEAAIQSTLEDMPE